MPPTPPSFGSQQYWDDRFTTNPKPFEWLEAPTALDPFLDAALQDSKEQRPEILHIGCGTSLLSYHLRAHVRDSEQIHNLDYSSVAIELGQKREKEIFTSEGQVLDRKNEDPAQSTATVAYRGPNSSPTSSGNSSNGSRGSLNDSEPVSHLSEDSTVLSSKPTHMRWSSANLLSPQSLVDVCKPSAYSIIIDKSTSDSIACADNITVSLPYPLTYQASSLSRDSSLTKSPEPLHPLHILAIHLAYVTKPGAHWIALSYSMDRFPFLHLSASALRTSGSLLDVEFDFDDDLDDIPESVLESGLPDPARLWKLTGKYEIEVPEPSVNVPNGAVSTTHRPRVLHWVYVLVRTDVKLALKAGVGYDFFRSTGV